MELPRYLRLLFLLWQVSSSSGHCHRYTCEECIVASECNFGVDFKGRGSCVLESNLESLDFKKVIYDTASCPTFQESKQIKEQILPVKQSEGNYMQARRGPVTVQSNPTTPTNSPQVTYGTASVKVNPFVSIKLTRSATDRFGNKTYNTHGNKVATLSKQNVNYNCSSYQRDLEMLPRVLCRATELIAERKRRAKLHRDYVILNMVNPMTYLPAKCKELKWRKRNC